MNRQQMLKQLDAQQDAWDFLIIGGGATGLGIAVDAASRGYKTLLLEKVDFAKGTSSRSTKLAHGGVRYLQQGDVNLVFEALKERGLLLQNAPHLVRNQSFIIPNYEWWNGPFYTVGLKVYDLMAGKLGLGSSTHISKEETIKAIPTVEQKDLKGGVIYQDGQFDDARLAVSLALTAADYEATLLNHFSVTGLTKNEDQKITGVIAKDELTGNNYEIKAKAIINATGVFGDSINKMDEPASNDLIMPSQGVHLVLDKDFLPNEYAIMVPQTSDGRVMFAVPWYDKVVVGTTDTLIDKPTEEPRALEEEINFILETAGKYLSHEPKRTDVLSVFAGLRPLAKPQDDKDTKDVSRNHKVSVAASGLISISGGKWTTYRKMAEDTVDEGIKYATLEKKGCITEHLLIHGYDKTQVAGSESMAAYGTDRDKVESLKYENETYGELLSESLKIYKGQVIWAARFEMAHTVEDVLARRIRCLFLDAKEAIRIAPETAQLMATELGKDQNWVDQEIENFKAIAIGYLA